MDLKRPQTTIYLNDNSDENGEVRRISAPSTSSQQQLRSKTAFEQRASYKLRPVYTNMGLPYLSDKFKIRRALSSNNVMMPFDRSLSKIRVARSVSLDVQRYKELAEIEAEEKPKRSLWNLTGMGLVYFGIEVLFSMETALTAPILLKLKVPEKIYSLVWVLSPLLGVILQPILGALSDRCQSRFGRRSPFIFLLGVGAFLGISFFLNNLRLGKWFGDTATMKAPINAIIIVAIGVTLLDFCADSSDSPLRALILDVCNQEDQDTGFNIHAILGGLGSATGYLLSAINWEQTFFKFIGNEMEILFTFAAIIFSTALTVTLISAKEKPIILREEKLPLIDSASFSNGITTLPVEFEEQNKQQQKTDSNSDLRIIPAHTPIHSEEPISLKLLAMSMLHMPIELVLLMICQVIGWLANDSMSLFLTDFIAQAIYNGDPTAPESSISYQNYNEGVKMGCWCLVNQAVSSAIYAFILEKFLLDRLSTKVLFLFGYLLYGCMVASFYFTKNIYIILVLYTSAGVLSTTLSTLPYQMLSEFHEDDNYRKKGAKGTLRGFGIDCALLSSCFFLAQTICALYTSPLVAVFGDYTVVVTSSSFAFLGCFWISLFMKFPILSDDDTNIDEAN